MAEPIAEDLLPEDAYDAGDTFLQRLEVIERAVKSWRKDSDNDSKKRREKPLLYAIEKLNKDIEAEPYFKRLNELKKQMEKG